MEEALFLFGNECSGVAQPTNISNFLNCRFTWYSMIATFQKVSAILDKEAGRSRRAEGDVCSLSTEFTEEKMALV